MLGGRSLSDVGGDELSRRWVRGGFPRSCLAASDAESADWRRAFARTFLERDLPQLGRDVAPATVRRLWTMLAHVHGWVLHLSDIGKSLGVSDHTARRWVDRLASALVVRQLSPWHENLRKRQVRSPKVYFADSGLRHSLLGLDALDDLEGHPRSGASWEGFLSGEVLAALDATWEEAHLWGTHGGAELGLSFVRGRRRVGFEFERTVAPRVTKRVHVALSDLGLERLTVVHAGPDAFPLAPQIDAVPAATLHEHLRASPHG